ncbi:MAG: hypothetical protein Q7U10_07315 [Thermodesulfovibrionia bacterium]|nr:hypothetical protein [Thermodesulfovibrionia bacterium]
MAVRAGMYGANKRRKELDRKKKQDEKRLKRKSSVKDSPQETEGAAAINIESESLKDPLD